MLGVFTLMVLATQIWGGTVTTEEERFPVSLFEFVPQLTFLDQIFPVNSQPTPFRSNANPGASIRFTPIWRDKFPLYFQLRGTQLVEQNDLGIAIDGEHGSLKYIWSFGALFGFRPFPTNRIVFASGLELNHEPFLRDEGGGRVFLNKVLIPTWANVLSLEYFRTERLSALLDLGFKLPFTVPMDLYSVRNGHVISARTGIRYKVNDLTLIASTFIEKRALNTNSGDVWFTNLGFEAGVGWGYGS